MISKEKYFLLLVLPFLFSSCFLKRKNKNEYSQDNFYKNDVNIHQTPDQVAKEYASLGKKQKKAYKKQLRRTDKAMRKRNKEKLKNVVIKTKTKRIRHHKDKGTTKEIEIK